MHHSLRIYSRYRNWFLRYYIFQARWTKIPLIGQAVRGVANLYSNKASKAYLLTLSEAEQIVDNSAGVALGKCDCRTTFHNCDNPKDTEILLGLTRDVFLTERPHDFHEITKDEAKEVIRQCHQKGLIHTIIEYRHNFYALCNCCSCCCVPYRLNKKYGIGNALTRNGDIVQEFKKRQLAAD